ncbi:MAG: SCP2 sterol-binding domain-containing protein [Saccharospirillaceae bacterium]|nr:SCP2 sterol-binding domain-containing protein [Pseudomonadales bacterium]NRB79374.1 SCP2 sterol-binding domain-containing protein [Saccharospirillaceae bacterium]
MQSALISLILLNQVAKAFEFAVAQAPECHKSLDLLSGKIVAIEINEIPQTIVVQFLGSNIEFIEAVPKESLDDSIKIDVSISADLKSFLELAKAQDKQQVMMTSNFNISGNTQTLMALQNFMAVFHVDFEAMLASIIGDESAVIMTKTTKIASDFALKQYKSIKATASNYIQNESGLTVAPYELDQFATEVRLVQMQVDRIHAKFQMWQKQQGGH